MHNLFQKTLLLAMLLQFSSVCCARELKIHNETSVDWWLGDIPGRAAILLNKNSTVDLHDLPDFEFIITVSTTGEVDLESQITSSLLPTAGEYQFHLLIVGAKNIIHIDQALLHQSLTKVGDCIHCTKKHFTWSKGKIAVCCILSGIGGVIIGGLSVYFFKRFK